MSDEAFALYAKDRERQQSQNEARQIRTRVNEARGSPHAAGVRWPFELLQNALDAGPRPGRKTVAVSLRVQDYSLTFEHDGAPFTTSELAALLSGGSSKKFESEETTGRFGTGFLVTHVLAEHTKLRGLLALPEGYERFDLILDRSGDEEQILRNILACNEAIRAATEVDDPDDEPSALFHYPDNDNEALGAGVTAFRRSLPYLYGTRRLLGQVHIALSDGCSESWVPSDPVERVLDSGLLLERSVSVSEDPRGHSREFRVLRFQVARGALPAALVVLTPAKTGWRVVVPEAQSPRIYREYPVRGSAVLPFDVVLDGKFEVDQDRSRLLMSEQDRHLLGEAFDAAVAAVSFGYAEGWANQHALTRATAPEAGFQPSDEDETPWWRGQLANFASRVAQKPVVATSAGYLPAVAESGDTAVFPIPRLHLADEIDGTTIDRVLSLAEACTALHPPVAELAADWTEICHGWSSLGLPIVRTDMKALAAIARGNAQVVSELAVEGESVAWLAQFIDVVGECWRNRDMMDISILAGILPNQNGALVSPTDLRRDGGIPEELKDICAGIGIDLRARLLTNELGAVADRNGLAFAPGVLTEAVPGEHTEDQTLEECVKKLESDLPEGSRDLDKRASAVAGSVRLLGYLWRTRGNNGGELAARIPLVTAENSVARWSRDRMLMAPVPRWHEGARGFSAAYPPGRILREDYGCSLAEDETDVVQALCAWGILHADPLTTQRPVELKDRRLAAIAVERAQTEGVTVAGQELSQIALLQPEVLNRCQEGPEEAAALLGLVLCYIAPTDKGWRTKLSALGRKGGQDARVDLWGALWLADLRFRSWVPVEDDGQYSKMTANMATLSTLVKSEWLAGNNAAVQLLSTWFGFDELELRLMATAPDLADRTRLKNELAGLVEVAGGAPGLYRTLAEQIVEQSRRSQQVERCRQFGLAVQEAVREALEARGLHLELVDRGFDYEVSAAMDAGDPMVDGAYRLSVGRYLLEVKATTTGQVRLTPAQAAAASGNVERYVLCVVDLRSVTPERLDKAWNARDVEPITKLIDGIGLPVQETRGLVAQAVARPVGIRNETALRYQVAESVWSAGCSMTAWVEQIGAEQLSGPDGTACSGYSALKPP